MKGNERFKVTIKDRITGDKTSYYVHSAGFLFNGLYYEDTVQSLRLVLEKPRKKSKSNNNKEK